MKIQWSPLAVDRVGTIADYIAQDDPFAAEKWVQSVFDNLAHSLTVYSLNSYSLSSLWDAS
jgi:plasmid stabilization system protein ParE